MELLETIAQLKPEDEVVNVHLITIEDEYDSYKQKNYLEKMAQSSITVGIDFSWEFDQDHTIHARHIVTDHGWKISLDRGLDIFQYYDAGDAFSFANRVQEERTCKAFEVTFLKQ
jgi:ATP-dependent Lon protease